MHLKKDNVRLSTDVIPKEYNLTLKPDLSTFTFEGDEEILLELKKPTKSITLHADEIEISEVKFGVQKGNVTFDKESETATITFPKELSKGEGKLIFKFTGILNDKMRGFYRSKYQHDGKDYHMAVSQLESTDARRAFPCFDEPAKKAIFHVNLIVPQDHTAISNSLEQEIKEHSSGYKIVSFAPTPKMSTYLLAFVVGKFEHIEKKTPDGVLVRVFVGHGKKKQAEFALDVAAKTISFFSEYFKIPYPLPVLDLIAIPDFAAGAMENWGAITYRETALLVDPEHTATVNKQWVALVIAHELAHQWFGNLVTMEWWTHLWLNEGFASYIEYLAVDELFPEWDIWTQFVSMDHSRALELDGLESTHPIEVEVNHPSEISEIFDAVSYSKGASIIRMLAEYLGHDVFRRGLQDYLKKHSYANAKTEDLWFALEKVSGKPVKKIMNDWTQKPGYPLISVSQSGNQINISQARFFSSIISQKNSNDSTTWTVPINIITDKSKNPEYHLMKKKIMTLPEKGEGWLKLNSGEKSLVRVSYSKSNLENLQKAIASKELVTEDRFGVIRDLFMLAEAGKATTDEALSFAAAYKNEDEFIVWSLIAAEFVKLSILLAKKPYYNLFEKYAVSVLELMGEKIGFEKKKNDTHTIPMLRSVIISSLGRYGHTSTIEKSKMMFRELVEKNLQIDSDLKGSIYTNVARYGDTNTYNQLMDLYSKSLMQEEKDRIFRALCYFKQEELLKKTLSFAFSSEVRAQDAYKAMSFIMANPDGQTLAWEFLKTKWTEIVEKYKGGHLFSNFVKPIEYLVSKEEAIQVEEFFEKNPAEGVERTVKQVIEQIYSNAAWMERDSKKIEDFLKKYSAS